MKVVRNALRTLGSRAGKIMLERQGVCTQFGVRPDGSLVTCFDRRINDTVIRYIDAFHENVKVIGEEACGGASESDVILLVDPIDGTSQFISGLSMSTTVFALLHKLCPLAAMINDPFNGRYWLATTNQHGSITTEFCSNDWNQSVGISDVDRLAGAKIWVSGNRSDSGLFCSQLLKGGVEVTQITCVTLFAGLMASGGMDGIVFLPPEQDLTLPAYQISAMELIVKGAGGKATDLHGNPLRYQLENNEVRTQPCVISNGHIHDELLQLVADSGIR